MNLKIHKSRMLETMWLKYWEPLAVGDFIAGKYKGVYPYSLSAEVNALWRQVVATVVRAGGKLHKPGYYLMLNHQSLEREILKKGVNAEDWVFIRLIKVSAEVHNLMFDVFIDQYWDRQFVNWDHYCRKHMIK